MPADRHLSNVGESGVTQNTTSVYNLSGTAVDATYQTFGDSPAADAEDIWVKLNSEDSDKYEVGLFTFNTGTPNTLTRVSTIESSNADSAVDFGTESIEAFASVIPGQKAVSTDKASTWTEKQIFPGVQWKVHEGTVNAGHPDFTDPYDTSTRSGRASAVDDAITFAGNNSYPLCLVPDSLLNYDASSVTFDNSVRMVREGGPSSGYDIGAYGAAGDGTTDDAPAINAADAAAAANDSTVYIPFSASDYHTESVVSFSDGVDVVGDGRELSTIAPSHAGRGVEVVGSVGSEITWNTYRDFGVVGDGTTTVGIYCELVGRLSFYRVKTTNHGSHGFHYFDGWTPTFKECRGSDNGGDGLFMEGGSNHNVTMPRVVGGAYVRNTDHGVHLNSPSIAGTYHGFGTGMNGKTGLFIEEGKSPTIKAVFFENDGDGTWPLCQIGTATTQIDNPEIKCNFFNSDSNNARTGLKVVRGDGGQVRLNRYQNLDTAVKVEPDHAQVLEVGPGFTSTVTTYLDYQGTTFTDDERWYHCDDDPKPQYVVGDGSSGLQVEIQNTGGASGGTLFRLLNEGTEVFRVGNGGMPSFQGNSVPSRQSYSLSNVTTDRTLDADNTTTAELADVLATVIQDLQAAGFFN